MGTPDDQTESINQKGKTRVQQIVGSLLYHARAVDPTIQANPAQQTANNLHQLLDFVATHKNATSIFTPSKMILKVHSDASYLSEP